MWIRWRIPMWCPIFQEFATSHEKGLLGIRPTDYRKFPSLSPSLLWRPHRVHFCYLLSMAGLQLSFLLSTGWVVSLRGDWAIFCQTDSGHVSRVWSAREKSPEILRRDRELNPGHEENRRWDTFILPLSYHDPVHREGRQWDTFILPLSYHDCQVRYFF